jgi:hypothetical protein
VITQGASGITWSTQRQWRAPSSLRERETDQSSFRNIGVREKASSPLPMCHDAVRFMRSDEFVGAYTHHEVHRRERQLCLTELESVAEMKEIIYTLNFV